MSGLVVDTDKCVGCRRCERVCGNSGIEVRERKAYVLDGCISCGMCVDACPVGALAIEKDSAGAADLSAYHDIWVVCQLGQDGKPLPVVLELLAKGRELAAQRGCELVAVLVEAAESDNAEVLLAAGADQVLRSAGACFAQLDASVYGAWLVELAGEYKPEVILYGATNFGRELAPRVAVLLQTGLTADCTILEMDTEKGLLQQTRPAFGGNLMATIVCPAHRPQMATVRPGIFAAAEPVEVSATEAAKRVTDVPFTAPEQALPEVLAQKTASAEGSITEAEVLVVVGRGIGDKKSLKPVQQLVDALGECLGTSVALGCTRPVVEAGWLDYSHQVGQTGVSVAPKLLISLGVSGAIQHVAGIGGAQTIVAINEDPDAPIFNSAQYKVVADCHAVVGELLEQLSQAKMG